MRVGARLSSPAQGTFTYTYTSHTHTHTHTQTTAEIAREAAMSGRSYADAIAAASGAPKAIMEVPTHTHQKPYQHSPLWV